LVTTHDAPDPGKYNPNYEAVSKNIPSINFNHKPTLSLKQVKSKQSNKNAKMLTLNSSSSQILAQGDIINSTNISPKNSCLKFNHYSQRKDIMVKKDHLPIISYLEPVNYTSRSKGLDFNKMKFRSDLDLLTPNCLDNPTICYYQPKYEFVLKNYNSPKGSVKFGPQKKVANKNYLVQKMWRSYDVTSDYKLVQLKSFVTLNKN
jgi:hypothetical protein